MTDFQSDEISIVSDAYTCWAERDMAALFANLDPNIVYVLHLDPAVFPAGGAHHGATAFRALLDHLTETFAYLRYERSRFAQDGNVVRFRVDYSYLHKASRQIISSSYLAEVTVRDRLIVRIEEFPDTGFVEAFFRFNAAVAASADGSGQA
jgi:ketosteroid isomerase-like protein